MLVSKTQVLLPVKVIGWLFLTLLMLTLYFKGDFSLSKLLIYSGMSLPFVAMVSWFWYQRLSVQKIESCFGSWFFRKKTIYTDLRSIELFTSEVDAKGKGDHFLLAIGVKIAGRTTPLSLMNNLDKLSEHAIVSVIHDVSNATGVTSIHVSEHFSAVYQSKFNKAFNAPQLTVNG